AGGCGRRLRPHPRPELAGAAPPLTRRRSPTCRTRVLGSARPNGQSGFEERQSVCRRARTGRQRASASTAVRLIHLSPATPTANEALRVRSGLSTYARGL